MERTITNDQKESNWKEITVSVPGSYKELTAGLAQPDIDFINENLFGIAMRKSNFDVTFRQRCKDIGNAQRVADEYFSIVTMAERTDSVAEKIEAAEKLVADMPDEIKAVFEAIKAKELAKKEKKAKAKAAKAAKGN